MPTTKEFALHIIAVAKRKALVQKIANARSRIQAVEKELEIKIHLSRIHDTTALFYGIASFLCHFENLSRARSMAREKGISLETAMHTPEFVEILDQYNFYLSYLIQYFTRLSTQENIQDLPSLTPEAQKAYRAATRQLHPDSAKEDFDPALSLELVQAKKERDEITIQGIAELLNPDSLSAAPLIHYLERLEQKEAALVSARDQGFLELSLEQSIKNRDEQKNRLLKIGRSPEEIFSTLELALKGHPNIAAKIKKWLEAQL